MFQLDNKMAGTLFISFNISVSNGTQLQKGRRVSLVLSYHAGLPDSLLKENTKPKLQPSSVAATALRLHLLVVWAMLIAFFGVHQRPFVTPSRPLTCSPSAAQAGLYCILFRDCYLHLYISFQRDFRLIAVFCLTDYVLCWQFIY